VRNVDRRTVTIERKSINKALRTMPPTVYIENGVLWPIPYG
jgi:hypothetical protein